MVPKLILRSYTLFLVLDATRIFKNIYWQPLHLHLSPNLFLLAVTLICGIVSGQQVSGRGYHGLLPEKVGARGSKRPTVSSGREIGLCGAVAFYQQNRYAPCWLKRNYPSIRSQGQPRVQRVNSHEISLQMFGLGQNG